MMPEGFSCFTKLYTFKDSPNSRCWIPVLQFTQFTQLQNSLSPSRGHCTGQGALPANPASDPTVPLVTTGLSKQVFLLASSTLPTRPVLCLVLSALLRSSSNPLPLKGLFCFCDYLRLYSLHLEFLRSLSDIYCKNLPFVK